MSNGSVTRKSASTLGFLGAGPAFPAIVVLALALLPLLQNRYLDGVATEILLLAIFAMSLNILAGYTGLLSFGHAAFFGIGGYAVMIAGVQAGLSAWLGLVIAVIGSGLYAALSGYFCVRLSGVPFLMLTMAFSQLVFSLSVRWRALTGGTDGLGGLPAPHILGFSLSSSPVMFYVALTFFALCYWAISRLLGSQLGHTLVGLRENTARMETIGYPIFLYKWLSFTIAGALAGLSGGLYVMYNRFVSPDVLHWTLSGDVIMMLILGGIGTTMGPLIGAAIFLLMKNYVSSQTDHWLFFIGVIFIVCVIFFPEGVWGSYLKSLESRRRVS